MTNEEFRKKFIGRNLTGQKSDGAKPKKAVKVYQSNFGMFKAKPGDIIPVDDVPDYITSVDPYSTPSFATTAMRPLVWSDEQAQAIMRIAAKGVGRLQGDVTLTTGVPRTGRFIAQRVPDQEPSTWRHKLTRVLDRICGIPKESKL